MKPKPRIHVEVRLNGDYPKLWMKHSWHIHAGTAVNQAKRIRGAKDESGFHIFTAIRLRYMGRIIDRYDNF